MSQTYDHIFSSTAQCLEPLTSIEATFAIGVMAMAIDNYIADEEIANLEAFLDRVGLAEAEREPMRRKIQRLIHQEDPGALFNTAKKALAGPQLDYAFYLAIRTILADQLVHECESDFAIALAHALQLSDEKFHEIVLRARADHEQAQPFDTPLQAEVFNGEVFSDEIAVADPVPDFPANTSTLMEPSPLMEAVVQFFQGDQWQIAASPEESVVRTNFEGQHGNWICHTKIREEAQQIVFYSICPFLVPAESRLLMAEFLTRANFGLFIGNFEMDFADGTIRYKSSIDLADDRFTTTLMKRLVYANVMTMDKYLPGIAVVLEGRSPEAAIAEIET